MFFFVRSVWLAVLFFLVAAVSVNARAVNYGVLSLSKLALSYFDNSGNKITDLEGIPMGEYRLEPFGDYGVPQKRVPSAGDMMVRFGKRGAV